jgi:hypothetical protein
VIKKRVKAETKYWLKIRMESEKIYYLMNKKSIKKSSIIGKKYENIVKLLISN